MIKLYNIITSDDFLLSSENIYKYIANKLYDSISGEKHYNDILKAVKSLKHFPNRGSLLGYDEFTDRSYRKIFVHNYTIIYYVEDCNVYIVDIFYSASDIKSKLEKKFKEE